MAESLRVLHHYCIVAAEVEEAHSNMLRNLWFATGLRAVETLALIVRMSVVAALGMKTRCGRVS